MLTRAVALMMEAAQTSEISVNSYQATRRYNPEDGHLHTHSRENLRSHRVHGLQYGEDIRQPSSTATFANSNGVPFELSFVRKCCIAGGSRGAASGGDTLYITRSVVL
jgi:hypothetical protein